MSKVRMNFYLVKQVKEKGGLYEADRDFVVRSPEDAYIAAKTFLQLHDEPCEHFGIFTLNTKNKIVGVHVLFKGSLNASIVHPREVFQACLLNNAASFIAFHNHPSQDPTPSREDIDVTKRLVEAGKIMGMDCLDHIIVCEQKFVSIKEKGYI